MSEMLRRDFGEEMSNEYNDPARLIDCECGAQNWPEDEKCHECGVNLK